MKIIIRLFRCLVRGISLISAVLCLLSVLGYYRSPRLYEGFLYGSSGGYFFAVATDGEGRGKLLVVDPWPVHQGFDYVSDPGFIGPSGVSRGVEYFNSYPQWNTLIEKGSDNIYVADDDRTPILNSASQIASRVAPFTTHFFLMLFPLKYLIAATAIFPVAHGLVFAVAVFRRARRRKLVGLCPTCHYDLRAHQVGGRCPECGTPKPPAALGSGSRSNS